MYEKIIHNTEELNAMAMHLRTSQNFHELKVLAAEWLVPETDVEDFISGKRFQLAEIPLSEKDYASAAEKLREEMWLLGDQLFADVLVQYLIQKAKEDALFSFQVLKKNKSLQKCMNFIMGQAYEIAKEEYEKRSGGNQAGKKRANGQREAIGMGIAETKVYQWAEEYYALDDAAEEAKTQGKERRKRLRSLRNEAERSKQEAASIKPAVVQTSKETSQISTTKNEEEYKPQEVQEQDAKENAQNPESQQMSIFDLL